MSDRPSRSALVQYKGRHRLTPGIEVGDEAVISLPSVPADADLDCTITRPDGETIRPELHHRSTDLFSDHIATITVDADGRWRYLFTANGRRCGGSFVVQATTGGKGT